MNGTGATLRSLLLISGYTRKIMKCSLISTPKEIISMISNYFLTGNPYLILWNGSGGSENAGIHILNITKGSGSKLAIIDIKTNEASNFMLENNNKYAGLCIVSNIKVPSWLWLQNECGNMPQLQQNNVSMIFRFGGRDAMWQSTDLCEMILYADTDNDAFHIQLPSLSETISSAAYIYNKAIGDNIYCFGGADSNWDRMDKISYFNLATLQWTQMKSTLCASKCFPSLCNYNENNIFIIGGFDGEFAKNMEMFNVANDTIMNCKDMIYDSSSASSIIVGDKIFAVGGLSKQNKATQFIQMYDINNNEWSILNKKSNHNKNIKYIFNVLNPNIIYISGQFTPKQNENTFIEWLDLRDNHSQFQLLHKTANHQLFNLQNVKDLQKVLPSFNYCNLS